SLERCTGFGIARGFGGSLTPMALEIALRPGRTVPTRSPQTRVTKIKSAKSQRCPFVIFLNRLISIFICYIPPPRSPLSFFLGETKPSSGRTERNESEFLLPVASGEPPWRREASRSGSSRGVSLQAAICLDAGAALTSMRRGNAAAATGAVSSRTPL